MQTSCFGWAKNCLALLLMYAPHSSSTWCAKKGTKRSSTSRILCHFEYKSIFRHAVWKRSLFSCHPVCFPGFPPTPSLLTSWCYGHAAAAAGRILMSAVAAVGKRGRKKDLLKKFFFSSPRNRRRRSVRRGQGGLFYRRGKVGNGKTFLKRGRRKKG